MHEYTNRGTNWPAWTQCEVDPLYQGLHPNPPETLNRGHWLREAQRDRNDGRFLERTFNWYKDARKFCPGVLSASGYYLLNDSESAVLDADDFPVERDRPGCQDWYFFAYGRDYQTRRSCTAMTCLLDPRPFNPRWCNTLNNTSIAGYYTRSSHPLLLVAFSSTTG